MMRVSLSFILMLLPLMLFPEGRGQTIEISTANTAMIIAVGQDRELVFHYYGNKLTDSAVFLEKESYRRSDYGTEPQPYPVRGGRYFGEPCLSITHGDGNLNTRLLYTNHTAETKNGFTETRISLADPHDDVGVELVYRAYADQDVIVCHSEIRNNEPTPVVLDHYYSSALAVKASDYYLTSFYGAWGREMTVQEEKLAYGIRSIETKKQVRTTHTENPSFILSLDHPRQERYGKVIAGTLAWSGNYKLNFQRDEFDILSVTSGINPYSAAYTLAPGSALTTPDMIYTFSGTGVGQASRNLHDWARRYSIWNPEQIRPTLINSWEGVYFDFTADDIRKMIDQAAQMGLEMFVLDDGWFGNAYPRDHATQGLGDWQVNRRKLPDGIAPLARYAVDQGLRFGLWIEPEMVNPRSELARNHPDWILGDRNSTPPTIRDQWLLDLCNPQVQDYIVGVFDRVIGLSPDITYIKWDANRHVEAVYSPFLPASDQSHVWVEYTKGLYSVYERIRAKHPDVMIQSCASGGGRLEYGHLKYHDEVWTSDNTDALSRIFIQYGTNMIFPALITGAHVSASPNHQTGNQTPLKFRFDVAMSGRLGMEMQPQELNPQEKEFARHAIAEYKKIRDVIMTGDLYRICSPYSDAGIYSTMYVSKDKTRAVLFAYCIKYQGRALTPKLELSGLDPDKPYKITELNVEKSIFWGDRKVIPGDYLVNEGINLPLRKLYDSVVFLLEHAAEEP